MTVYRNVTAKLAAPSNKLDHAAIAVLDVLQVAAGAPVISQDLRQEMVQLGADPDYLPVAVKALRNMGYPIIAVKARQNSWYKLPASSTEYETHRQAVVSEGYSRVVTTCRELAGAVTASPADLQIGAAHKYAQMLAIALGTDTAIGKTIPEVITELAPL